MSRPSHLPSFQSPPLSEVVISVQFPTPVGYQHIFAREVWSLFQNRFPKISEQFPLSPNFEIFGNQNAPIVHFNFSPPPFSTQTRYWFINESDTKLLQFQPDRFIQNWRNHTVPAPYPHFEELIDSYSSEIELLNNYFSEKWSAIAPNQCELTYINQIQLTDEEGNFRPASFYFNRINPSLGKNRTDFNMRLQTEVDSKNDPDKPIGRLIVDASTAVDAYGRPVLGLNLTMRGSPATPTIKDALTFMLDARETITNSFTDLTSSEAHKLWGRRL